MDQKNIQVVNTEKKLDWHKVFAPIGAALIVVILVSSAVWIYLDNQGTKITLEDEGSVKIATSSAKISTKSAKIDETLDWKTYTNTEVNFSIKYPRDWKLTESSTNTLCSNDQAFFAPTDDLLGRCASGFGGLVGITRVPIGATIDTYVPKANDPSYENLKIEETKLGNKRTVKFSGISTVSNEVGDNRGTKMVEYLVDLTDRTLIINYTQKKEWKDYSKEFEFMVSTFKFL
jgi:hypothetical protein